MALAPVTACTSDDADAKQPMKSPHSPESVPTPSTTASDTAQPSVRTPPELDADETLAGRQQATTGNADFKFSEGKKGQALIIAVRCQGSGEIKVSVPTVQVSFPLDCVSGEVSTSYNQVVVGGVERSGTVSVKAPSAVKWSMTIGRGKPAQVESSGTA
ncbi:hypothetical protein [Streptomyces antibioticus]|uniref:hypothetical protein n=1 Tax=Streptomyces antibioticus TaxID=1890 RepID=UPI0033BCC532